MSRASWKSLTLMVLLAVGSAFPLAAQDGPMDLFIAYSRSQLSAQGFVRHEAPVEGRRAVWWEKGSGPTVVLVHGVADQSGTWFMIAPALAESHRVLLIDLPGHGESEPVEGPLPMTLILEGFKSWLAAHAESEAAAAPTLVGNSMGAWIAMLVAHRDRELAGRVVAVNGGPLRPEAGGLTLQPETREDARQLMAALRDPGSMPTPDPVLDDLVRRAKVNQVQRMFDAEDDLESYLLEGRLGEIEAPVDILWGESDRYMGADYPERLRSGLPRARLTLIPRCGHIPQAECPAVFIQKLEEVLALPAPGLEAAAGDG